ncbi:transposase [Enhygromyxa salina]|uniref:Transposase n=1 Tax=Enhygromyxa salina TaxID=215803 RepID=A0A2S9YAF9_9BACT|nr:transposase [Enhygromyxa salina]PRQ02085.1 hypothetical protein ENSA7_55920 [Enhygromyxa salina]
MVSSDHYGVGAPDSSLRLDVHFHCLVLDGVYVRDGTLSCSTRSTSLRDWAH